MFEIPSQLIAENSFELLGNWMFGRILSRSPQSLAETYYQVAQFGYLTDAVGDVGRLMQILQIDILFADVYILVRQRRDYALAAPEEVTIDRGFS